MNASHVQQIRAFNRFYTGIMGLLDRYILNSHYSLPEVRVLYEVYHHDSITASSIIALMGIDKGYLSRMLRQFEKKKIIRKHPSPDDGRSICLSLTALGKKEFEALNEVSNTQVSEILEGLTETNRRELVKHMAAIESILSTVK